MHWYETLECLAETLSQAPREDWQASIAYEGLVDVLTDLEWNIKPPKYYKHWRDRYQILSPGLRRPLTQTR
jgi:hypothetical protein